MKFKPIRLLDSEQLWSVVLRKSSNNKQSRILPLILKKLGISVILFLAIPTVLVEAQVTPDESLSTNVEQQGENQLNINGGEREGNNLFHSFQEFSVPEGIEAVFENAPDIENIFTRITGEEASAINGILRTQGGANFFLVNPNGIVFGENAQLDVGGSFIATTANSVQFEDGTEFAADDAQEKPILTVSVPIGLQFEGNNGAITVNGTGNQIASDTRFSPIDLGNTEKGLSVTPGKTLALIGGDITLDGGIVTAEGARVAIGSVNSGSVSLQEIDSKLAFGYENADSYQDIALTQQALLDASGEGSGAISLTGNNISLSDSSFILIQNQGQVDSSSININAFESLTLSGTTLDQQVSSGIRSESLGIGQGAKIDISTGQLQLRDGAQIIGTTYSEALGSNISINASDSIEMFGGSISAGTFAEGDAGSLQVSSNRIEVMEGGSITSSTIGSGDGGKVTINADLINVVGRVSIDRSNIAAVSFNAGNAGSLNINTKQLRVRDQALVNTSARATGNAGSITINASESIEVSGTNKNFPSTIRAGVELTNSEARTIFGLPEVPSGNAGNIIINSPKLDVMSEGVVNVSNEGTGDAGTLFINAEKVNLYDTGSILATTASGTGGNINLSTQNLEIGAGSKITATAENDGDGGNITINTNTLIAKKNSDVTANAFTGRGGNINIDAEGLFLFDSPENIFSASSQLGIDGRVQINTPDIDLQKELEQSELEILTTEEAIAKSCLARDNQPGSFTVNNGGGMPKSPNSEYSDIEQTLTGVRSLPTTARQSQAIESNYQQSKSLMLPAERMVETEDGRIFLLAAPPKPESLFCPQN